jgi:hypothetical protein
LQQICWFDSACLLQNNNQIVLDENTVSPPYSINPWEIQMLILLTQINWLAVDVAGIAAFIIGFIIHAKQTLGLWLLNGMENIESQDWPVTSLMILKSLIENTRYGVDGASANWTVSST